jgi:hypothetical protein
MVNSRIVFLLLLLCVFIHITIASDHKDLFGKFKKDARKQRKSNVKSKTDANSNEYVKSGLVEKKKSPPPSNYDYKAEASSDDVKTVEVTDPSFELKNFPNKLN